MTCLAFCTYFIHCSVVCHRHVCSFFLFFGVYISLLLGIMVWNSQQSSQWKLCRDIWLQNLYKVCKCMCTRCLINAFLRFCNFYSCWWWINWRSLLKKKLNYTWFFCVLLMYTFVPQCNAQRKFLPVRQNQRLKIVSNKCAIHSCLSDIC